jgi:hypothetical protein
VGPVAQLVEHWTVSKSYRRGFESHQAHFSAHVESLQQIGGEYGQSHRNLLENEDTRRLEKRSRVKSCGGGLVVTSPRDDEQEAYRQ